ncbi:C40 family peptidase [Hydrogenophilus thiooxidans]|uniref:C40 family peptidase n=1 Tax=Hydrogenophilus thiooxidans TaxID=2820326 RepID=UPI001C211CC5|nr:C40 family peptidase [Hydrogenophilus thiooxidans]
MTAIRPLALLALLGALFTLSACSTVGNNRSWLSAEPYTVASENASEEAEENGEEAEENDALDGWLQALAYRSPNYGFELPQRENRLREALKTAFDLQGTPYRSGGTSAQGLDCSGLVWVAFASAGIKLPRSSQEQFHATERITREALRPGDLVFFKTGRNKKRAVDHVGIYIGNDQFLHAPRRGKEVTVASMNEAYWTARFVGAGRVPGATAENIPSEVVAPPLSTERTVGKTEVAEVATLPSTHPHQPPATNQPKELASNQIRRAAATQHPAARQNATGTASRVTAQLAHNVTAQKEASKKVKEPQRTLPAKALATAAKQKERTGKSVTATAKTPEGARNIKRVLSETASNKPATRSETVKRTQTSNKKEAALTPTTASR